ncbi:hypothetical protein, conserved [Cyanidioschyzon merolae strain 10D]|jgi:GINS complex subunit 1|uniref:DNA replication complex GINS protein PSF1 n=1 Tax=Cyanidioschyzon merolae (strain NIES-3377 / 10D) TaxID=280699 RepID=M1VL57_CYAM1|nr:hypothetical protein, conserved [Cyanidioschyzon merolae strain 10D]BAM82393.1 hypothetical protein, conserved [Cyanidioschyzon merolae strain 10D]|eukprot:XP_005538429.1 hypothetical protein, conserved [Cyanidioschyzon merolae strain 10D]
MTSGAATALVSELRDAQHLPLYRRDLLQRVVDEILEEYAQLEKGIEAWRSGSSQQGSRVEDRALQGSLLVRRARLLRNKRCVLAYLVNRLRRVEQACWNRDPTIYSGPSEDKGTTGRATALLSEAERTYASRYEALLAAYGSAVGLDLRSALLVPPKEEFIEVRVLEDCGDFFMASSGQSAHLAKGTVHFVRRADVELLIQQGKLEHLTPKC